MLGKSAGDVSSRELKGEEGYSSETRLRVAEEARRKGYGVRDQSKHEGGKDGEMEMFQGGRK